MLNCVGTSVTPILIATVAYLLEAGCDPARRDDRERTPLHHAARLQDRRWLREGAAGARLRHQRGGPGRPDAPGGGGGEGLPRYLVAATGDGGGGARVGDALSRAAVACIAPLIAARCDPNAPGASGRLPLLVAAEDRGSEERVAALLRARADVGRREDLRDANGRTALHVAVKGRHLPVCRALFCEFGADLHAEDAGGKTPLQFARALRWSGAKELEGLEKSRQEQQARLRAQQREQLALAVRHGPLEQVRDLLQAAGAGLREPLGADVMAEPRRLNARLPLHAAAARAVPAESRAARSRRAGCSSGRAASTRASATPRGRRPSSRPPRRAMPRSASISPPCQAAAASTPPTWTATRPSSMPPAAVAPARSAGCWSAGRTSPWRTSSSRRPSSPPPAPQRAPWTASRCCWRRGPGLARWTAWAAPRCRTPRSSAWTRPSVRWPPRAPA
ncbi:unnamed protein product [Prorocentrum cordatum]|uniref:Uncharacterized protein n=1 Tax=Prorocentrum cordatum TaxID=2364126 RepID=A0ABN9PNC6_9DINO|nr:unnamed protein product [Polarella glacialis]